MPFSFNKVMMASVMIALASCSSEHTDQSEAEDTRQTLEEVVDTGDVSNFLAVARENARADIITFAELDNQLRPFDRVYLPEGKGKSPVVLFFHGCSGPTLSHEKDWAEFLNSIGVGLIAVDSYSGRGTNWQDACNFTRMTPWERASDVFSTVSYARNLDYVDPDNINIMGFSHGAFTIWSAMVFQSSNTPPINLDIFPEPGLKGVKNAFLFYGGCGERWTVPINTISFLAGNDRYIDESVCEKYVAANADMKNFLRLEIFPEATHTFDHSKPNKANIEAGSRYDAAATQKAQQIISTAINAHE